MIDILKQWFLSIGEQYNVNPIIFGTIYIGAIPFFSLSIAWLIKNYRSGKSIVLPVITAGICFVSAYVYLLIVGENVPWWVYAILIALLMYGVHSTVRKVRQSVSK